jgi:hypothetical protein
MGQPPHQLAAEFINGWKVFRTRFDEALKAPNLEEETEKQFLQFKIQLLERSKRLELITEKHWSLHGKIRSLLNNLQSLDFYRQESVIFHDNTNNTWHDIFVESQKLMAELHRKAEAEAEEG